jgi:hypothetical protein
VAIAFVAKTDTTYASRTNITLTAPAGVNTGDTVIALVLTGTSSEAVNPTPAGTGWTEIGSATDVAKGGFNVEMRLYKGLVGTVSSYVFNHTVSSSQGCVLGYSGVNTTTQEDQTATSNPDASSATDTRTWTGLTTVTNGAYIVGFGHDWGDNTNNLTPPSGTTERVEVNGIIYAFDEARATAGATGNRSHTCNNTLNPWAARLIALRPSSANAYNLDADAGSYSITGTTADLLHGWLVDAAAGSYAITGQDAGLSRGMPLDALAGSYAISGTVADLLHGYLVDADAGSYAVTGTTADLLVGYLLNADAGSYSITGSDAGFIYTFVVDAAAGSYAVTGSDADLSRGMPLDALAGSYSVSGTDADLLHGYLVDAAAGSYIVAGQDADLLHGYLLDGDAGSYAVTGSDASLEYVQLGAYLLTADPGAYTVSGTDADLLWGYLLDAEAGAYTVTGSDADLVYLVGYLLDADSGSYEIVGDDAEFLYGYLIDADAGSYEVTGTDAALVYDDGSIPEPPVADAPSRGGGRSYYGRELRTREEKRRLDEEIRAAIAKLPPEERPEARAAAVELVAEGAAPEAVAAAIEATPPDFDWMDLEDLMMLLEMI